MPAVKVPKLVTNLSRLSVPDPVNVIFPPSAFIDSSKSILAVDAVIVPEDDTTASPSTSKLLEPKSNTVPAPVTVRSFATFNYP